MYKDVGDLTGGCSVFWEVTSRSWSPPVTPESSHARCGKVGARKPEFVGLWVEESGDFLIYIYPTRCNFTHFIHIWKTALHVSGGTSTHHQERIQLYLQHLVFVRPLLLPAAIAAGSSNGLTNTRCCRYSCLRS